MEKEKGFSFPLYFLFAFVLYKDKSDHSSIFRAENKNEEHETRKGEKK